MNHSGPFVKLGQSRGKIGGKSLFRRHLFGCFITDDAGLALREIIGVDNITWECDYPHSDSLWPNSRERLEKALQDIPDEEAHKIAELNARRIFSFPG